MKINIVVDKALNAGQKANVSAIIMGQFGRDIPTLYANAVEDISGIRHAGISVNVVILDGSNGQLLTLIEATRKADVSCIVFSATGQFLSNSYPEYQQQISLSETKATNIIGVGIVGEDDAVRSLTKKFSLVK